MNGVEIPMSLPLASSSGSNENPATEMVTVENSGKEIECQAQDGQNMCSDLNASQEFVGGIMKIVPDVDVSVATLNLSVHWDEIYEDRTYF